MKKSVAWEVKDLMDPSLILEVSSSNKLRDQEISSTSSGEVKKLQTLVKLNKTIIELLKLLLEQFSMLLFSMNASFCSIILNKIKDQ